MLIDRRKKNSARNQIGQLHTARRFAFVYECAQLNEVNTVYLVCVNSRLSHGY